MAREPATEICPRCLQKLPVKARRCPNCRQYVSGSRGLPLLFGVAGLLAIAFVFVIMLVVVRNDDLENAPPTGKETPTQPISQNP